MSKKAYVVMEIGYQFDDESFNRMEYSEGTPCHVFWSKEKAQAEVNKRTAEKMRKISPMDYRDYYDDENDIMKHLESQIAEVFGAENPTAVKVERGELKITECLVPTEHRMYHIIGQNCVCVPPTNRRGRREPNPWPRDTTDRQLLELANILDLEFHQVVEVDADELE